LALARVLLLLLDGGSGGGLPAGAFAFELAPVVVQPAGLCAGGMLLAGGGDTGADEDAADEDERDGGEREELVQRLRLGVTLPPERRLTALATVP
jgi:hypothetical protein